MKGQSCDAETGGDSLVNLSEVNQSEVWQKVDAESSVGDTSQRPPPGRRRDT